MGSALFEIICKIFDMYLKEVRWLFFIEVIFFFMIVFFFL